MITSCDLHSILNFIFHVIVVDCLGLPDPGNGSVNFSSTTYRSEALYQCSEGFVLEGPRSRFCTSSGVWSDVEPVCAGKLSTVCPSPIYK